MKIRLSRHAKRRAKLYSIEEYMVINILKDMELADGKHEIVREVAGLKFPLKIVVNVESDNVTVTTNYPVKKGKPK